MLLPPICPPACSSSGGGATPACPRATFGVPPSGAIRSVSSPSWLSNCTKGTHTTDVPGASQQCLPKGAVRPPASPPFCLPVLLVSIRCRTLFGRRMRIPSGQSTLTTSAPSSECFPVNKPCAYQVYRVSAGATRCSCAYVCTVPCGPHPVTPTHRTFQEVWGRGEPIIVRGLAGAMGWTPEGMGRVCKEGAK